MKTGELISPDACRLCMDEKRTKMSLHAETHFGFKYADIVSLFTKIQIFPDDGLPQLVCSKCISILQTIYDFKTEIEQNDDILNSNVIKDEEEKPSEQDQAEEETEYLIEALSGPEEALEEAEEEDQPTNTKPTKRKRSKNYQCPICNHKVESPSKLKRHIRIHVRSQELSEAELKKLGIHVDVASLQRPVERPKMTCDVCSKNFPTRTKLRKHLQIHLPPEERPKEFVCECGKEYLDVYTLRVHQSIHHATEPIPLHQCSECSKAFARKSYLDTHMKIHKNVKDHLCRICGFSTTKSGNLTRHMLVHSDQFNYSCDICGRKFKRQSGVEIHMQSHSNAKPHICPRCRRAYASHSGLVKHLRREHDLEYSKELMKELETLPDLDEVDDDESQIIYVQVNEGQEIVFATNQ